MADEAATTAPAAGVPPPADEATSTTTAAAAAAAVTTTVASAVPASILPASGVSTPGGPATGTVTPALSELPPDQIEYSLKVSLADLCAKGAVLYAQQKNYEEASEVYARAAEMQAEMNGEMNPENAEILFLYGRSLFKVGQSKSDVLGGKAPETNTAAGDEKKAAKKETKKEPAAEGSAAKKAKEPESKEEGAALDDAKKPLFQFTGDEEWDDDSDEEAAEGDEEEKEEEEDDLAVAFEVLDLSRVLFEKQLEEKKNAAPPPETATDAATTEAKGKETETKETIAEATLKALQVGRAYNTELPVEIRHIMERLADTHDLLAEISLENERYPNAIVDSRASLSYKKQFLPEESEIIAEAHFKLSLALEFASVTTASEGDAGAAAAADSAAPKDQQVDQELRDEAARELELAIASTKLKLQNKEVELATLHSPEDNDSTRRQIAEVKDIISDMEQRLVDLRKPPIDLNEAVNGPANAAIGGLLGAFGGAASSAAAGASGSGGANVEEAKKAAKDLTGLVRKKAKDVPAAATSTTTASTVTVPVVETESTATNGNANKRKADEPAEGEEDESKKAKTAEPVEA